MLHVTLYTIDTGGDTTAAFLAASDPETVDYVSLYNGGTHGPPALVAPGRQEGQSVRPKARPGDSVLYINTALIPAFKIERAED